MIIKAITYNVRGLNDARKTDKLRHYLQNFPGGLDIILLQEHKLRGEKAAQLGRKLFPKHRCWTMEADLGYNIDGQAGAGRGGICTLLHGNLAARVSEHGSILQNRAFWLRLTGLPGGDLGVLNLYAPNNTRDRVVLWQELTTRLPIDCRWLISGDFNMTESAQDKSTLCSKLMSQEEKQIWEAFKSSLHLSDTFICLGKLKYSWDNRRRDGCRILGRLDRHYTSSSPGTNLHLPTRNYIIRGDCSASDHLPVSIEVTLQDVNQRKSCFKMNTAFLHNPEVLAVVEQIWSTENCASSHFFARLRKFTKFYKSLCKRKAQTARWEETEACDALSAAQEALQENPQDTEAQLTLAQRQAQLLTLEDRKLEGRRIRARLRWKDKGDAMTKEFFNAVKEKAPRAHISELTNPGGDSTTNQLEIERACLAFYRDLCTAKASDEETRRCEVEILEAVPESVTPLMALAFGKPLLEQELHAAACALAKEKAPGPDGIAVNFFTCFWPQIGEDFSRMIRDAISVGRFPKGVTKGLITLLPKSGDLKLLNNWRPITLLNVSYKIFAKALQIRLQEPLNEIISLDQCAYLRNRFILDNILLTHETLAWAKKSKQETIFLKLDFSKAFDRVDWPFLFNTMAKMGFPPSFTNMVKLTMSDAKASININGVISPAFKIERGVRQGCPLAPFLFLVMGEALHVKVRLAQAQGRIQGVKLLRSETQQLTLQYADDTSFTVRANLDSTSTLVNILQSFSLASGLLINWAKSGAYWQGRNAQRPAWSQNFGWSWIPEGNLSKLLGSPFGLSISTADIDNFLVDKVRRKLTYWTSTKLSLAGRRLIVNQVLMSTLWYFIGVWAGSRSVLKQIKSLLRNYLWAGRKHRARARVAWDTCTKKQRAGSLSLIDPHEALDGLMSKWLIKACEPGISNLQTFLRYRLFLYKSTKTENWAPDGNWFLSHSHRSAPGSKVWNRTGRAWQRLVKHTH